MDQEEQHELTTKSTIKNIRDGNNEDSEINYARKFLYLSHFCTQFSLWAWQFSLFVWLAALSDNASLFLASVYQATAQLLVLVLVPKLSKHIDRDTAGGTTVTRSQFVSYLITSQNTCVLLDTLLIAWTMKRRGISAHKDEIATSPQYSQDGDPIWVCSLIAICVLGGLAEVLAKTLRVAVERDWIVVMANEDATWLQQANVGFKQVDLTCQVLGPILTGWVLDMGGGVGYVCGCTVVSFVVEYACMNRVYQLVPCLRPKGQPDLSSKVERISDQHDALPPSHQNESSSRYCSQLRVYASQTMAWAGIGLALLYFNVLTFGGVMTAYLISCGMSLPIIGAWRGVASLMGLLGTFAFAKSQKYMELEVTGLWSIVWEFLCLSVSLSSIFVRDTDATLAAALLIGGILPSRIGLWVHDISVTQLFQQTVAPPVRGQVGGTQTGFNALVEFLPFVLGMVYSDVQEFWILMVGGYMSVGAAMVFYFVGTYLPYSRGYLAYPRDDKP